MAGFYDPKSFRKGSGVPTPVPGGTATGVTSGSAAIPAGIPFPTRPQPKNPIGYGGGYPRAPSQPGTGGMFDMAGSATNNKEQLDDFAESYRSRQNVGTGPFGDFLPLGSIGSAARDATKDTATRYGSRSAQETPAYGSQSGPGILESWFNQRATGTDPAFEYASQRGLEAIANRSSAAGNFNSGATRQQESDFMANLVAQRMGQLDALAGGASGEHMGRLGMMFDQGTGLARGQSGLASAYDLGAAGNIAAANNAMNQMALNSAAQQQQAHQGYANNVMSAWAALYGGGGSGS